MIHRLLNTLYQNITGLCVVYFRNNNTDKNTGTPLAQAFSSNIVSVPVISALWKYK